MKHSKVRQHIIETASTLFYQNGYNSTGINEIIKEAGIAKATLYNHFPSKDDICLAYLHYKNETFIYDIKSFVQQEKPGKDRILSLFHFLKSFFNQKDFNGCWCLNTVAEIPSNNECIINEIQKQKKAFIDFIQELVIEYCPQKTDAQQKALAHHVYLLYESALAESKVHQDAWPIDSGLSLCNQILT